MTKHSFHFFEDPRSNQLSQIKLDFDFNPRIEINSGENYLKITTEDNQGYTLTVPGKDFERWRSNLSKINVMIEKRIQE